MFPVNTLTVLIIIALHNLNYSKIISKVHPDCIMFILFTAIFHAQLEFVIICIMFCNLNVSYFFIFSLYSRSPCKYICLFIYCLFKIISFNTFLFACSEETGHSLLVFVQKLGQIKMILILKHLPHKEN